MDNPVFIITIIVIGAIAATGLIYLFSKSMMNDTEKFINYIKGKMPSKSKSTIANIMAVFLVWAAISIVSFIFSPIIALIIYVAIVLINFAHIAIVALINGLTVFDCGETPDVFLPKWEVMDAWFGFWIFMTICYIFYIISEIRNENNSKLRKKEMEESQKRQMSSSTIPLDAPTPPEPLPPPKPILPQITLPRAPNTSVRKYYCLDDGITAKTWLTMNEAKYYVSTLSFKKVLQLDGKHIVCRIYTKGSWVSHSMTQINCDDNGKLTFGRTTRL